MKRGKNSKRTLGWISTVAGASKWLVACLVVLQSLLSLTGVFFAFALRAAVNAAVAGNRRGFFGCLALLGGMLGLQILLQALNRMLNEATHASVENRFKSRLFSSLLTGDYARVTATHSGEWMNRLTSDTVAVANGATQIVPGLLGMLVRLTGALAALVWLERRFLVILVPGGAVTLLLTYAFRRVLKRLHKRIQEADGALRVFLQERLESLLIVRAFDREAPSLTQADGLMEGHRAARLRRARFSGLCGMGLSGVMNGAYLLGIGFCGLGILAGSMSYGDLMAIMQLIGQVQSPFANITGYLPKLYAMLASAERLMEAEQYARDSERRLTHAQTLDFYRSEFVSLRMEHACFAYQPPVQAGGGQSPAPVVLEDVELEIKKGEYVVFTGPSGCGKSTVLKLLMCLYPLDSGERILNTTRGRQALTPAFRSLFAYVPQGNQLLSGSIREIIAFGDEERARDDAAIREALSIACADEFVMALEHGLDTVLGERGTGLSEGQMQRIAIARAVFSGRPILMLDEATSALDETTAARMLANLRRMTDKTVILVTHRADQAAAFDKELSFSRDGIGMKSGSGEGGQ
ncbi:MAG: ABC transporter ATP-binding protein [bacterium]|nr:ABC transporter ATP-binding protein [bacterium]